jgi:uncharacterized protein
MTEISIIAKNQGWRRFLRQPVVATIAEILILAVPLNLVYGFAMHTVYRLDSVWGVLFAIVAAVVGGNVYNLYARWLALRVAQELAPQRLPDLMLGAALGAFLICVILLVIALEGSVDLSAGGWPSLAGLPAVALLAGFFEELIARGVVLRNLENVFGSEIAIALSAALFGWLHIGNPHATTLSAAAIGIEGGVMLAAIYIATRSLWWTVGVHLAWNFTQTTIFGIADSGHRGTGILRAQVGGPDWLTGGAFGIEASAISVVVCALVALGFLVHAYRNGRIVAPLWEHRRQ